MMMEHASQRKTNTAGPEDENKTKNHVSVGLSCLFSCDARERGLISPKPSQQAIYS